MKKAPVLSVNSPELQRTDTTLKSQLHYACFMAKLYGVDMVDPYLPEMKKGRYTIKHVGHSKGEVLDVVDTRMAYFGRVPRSITMVQTD